MNTMNPTRFYFASKPWHAPMWRERRDELGPDAEVVSTWIDEPGERGLDLHELPSVGPRCLADLTKADALILYEEAGDSAVWTGALIEVGAALDRGIPVLAVVSDETRLRLACWPITRYFASLNDALAWRKPGNRDAQGRELVRFSDLPPERSLPETAYTNGHKVEVANGSEIELWDNPDGDHLVIMRRPLEDGRVSVLSFGLYHPAALALTALLYQHLFGPGCAFPEPETEGGNEP